MFNQGKFLFSVCYYVSYALCIRFHTKKSVKTRSRVGKCSGNEATSQLHQLGQLVCHCYRLLLQSGAHHWVAVCMHKMIVEKVRHQDTDGYTELVAMATPNCEQSSMDGDGGRPLQWRCGEGTPCLDGSACTTVDYVGEVNSECLSQ